MARRNLPPLNGLRAFEAAARLGSFAAAGSELGVTPGAVSQQVRALEARLGFALFERRPQSLAPTRPARDLLPVLTDALDAIAAAAARLQPASVTPLRLASPAGFAAGFLLPRLDRLQRRAPGIALTLSATERLVEPGGGEADAAIRFGRAGWRGDLACDFLFADRRLPVCSPRYALSQPVAAASADPLAGHILLEALSQPEDWADWLSWTGGAAGGARRLTFGDERLTTAAAERGLGIALCDRALVADRLLAGALLAPLEPREMLRGTAWYLVYPAAAAADPAITACRAWLLDESDGPMP